MPHMRVSLKILMTLLLVAGVPVAVSGMTSVVLSRAAVMRATNENLESEARHLAELAESRLLGALQDLEKAAQLPFHTLSSAELDGALQLILRGDNARAAVALIDGATGASVGAPVFFDRPPSEPELADHALFAPGAVEGFAQHIPLKEALAAGKAISEPYADAARRLPLVALAVRVQGPAIASGGSAAWVVATELSLGELNRRFEEARDERLTAALLDLHGRVVCHSDRNLALQRADLSRSLGGAALAGECAGSCLLFVCNSALNLLQTAR
jgi:hypothetical protein